MSSLYAIRCKSTGEWYKPFSIKKRMWNQEFKRAKLYNSIGHAKSAITCKTKAWDYWKKSNGPTEYKDKEEREAFKKFLNAEIVCVGQSTTYYNI